jgi:membrane fusion protein, multidrug efflux system
MPPAQARPFEQERSLGPHVYSWIIVSIVVPVFAAVAFTGTSAFAENQLPIIKVAKVSKGKDGGGISAMGSVSCPRRLELGFDDVGIISEMLVEEGDQVKGGDVLAKLDDSVIKAGLVVAKARLRASQAEMKFFENELEKKKSLFDKQAVSDTEVKKTALELEKAQAAEIVASAELQKLEVEHKKKMLTAPISGVIVKRFMEVGTPVSPGTNKVVLLVQCDEVFADLELGEKLYPAVRKNQPVRVKVDALPGLAIEGVVDRIGPEIDLRSRTFKLRARLPNPDLIMRPGMFVRTEIRVSDKEGPLAVPKRALLDEGGPRNAVFVVKDGVVFRKDVSVEKTDDTKAFVTGGLEEGDLVIVEGKDQTRELDEVKTEIVVN